MCLYGPPGVGKTSLGKSVAEALGRKFYRISLGGVRDEAEIRGHRRTYVGSMPGVIIQSLKKIKTNNPVFLLDEIDKLGRDHNRGDPGSAMLEVLDPSQNDKFSDHFLGTPFNLSNVFFMATANSLDTIHPALLDRMEVIDISGYSLQEKLQIAKRYLLPKQIKENGISEEVVRIEEAQVEQVIAEYTMESGVRNLDRAIGAICRSVAYEYAVAKDPKQFKQVLVDEARIKEALGNPRFDFKLNERITRPGIAIVRLSTHDFVGPGVHRSWWESAADRNSEIPRYREPDSYREAGRRDEGVSGNCSELDQEPRGAAGPLSGSDVSLSGTGRGPG